ncbi:MAG: RagB/SusD family nutrient uptake outer membrane protein [Prevotellaceae bacterium]|jgi:hypothetical protein|nr:RagB/SusD family nutrient uptake outer membrane protein [Prevotellaceae bacterium]
MKSFLSVVPVALLILTFASCNDEDNNNNNDDPSAVITEAEASALVNAAYVPLQWLCSYNSVFLEGLTEVLSSVSEDVAPSARVSRFEIDRLNDIVIELFSDPYASIGSANLAIAQIEAAPVNANLTQAQKDYQIARAKFIRGHSYFKLVQTFGEVPILTSDAIVGERRPIDEVYGQAVKDLTEAAAHLPAYDPQKSNPSKAAVNTILAKLYLTWGQKPVTTSEIQSIANTQNDPAKPAPDAAKLQQAVTYANAVLADGQYHLLTNFNDIWGVNHENNAEVIFSVRHDGDDIDGIAGGMGNHQTHCGFTWPKDPRLDPHLNYADVTLADRIPDGDARKLLSYVTYLDYEDGEIDTLTWPISVVRPGKWIHRTASDVTKATIAQPNNIDRIDYRYAEVLLIKAEALFFLGNTAEALPLVNQLRNRAGVTPLSSLTAQDLYNEWDKEFAFEQKRWFNLVRWRNYVSTVKTALEGFEYIKDEYASAESIQAAFPTVDGVNYPFYVKLHTNQNAKLERLNGKFYRLPIPAGYEYEDLGITPQNPGY